MIKPLKCEPTHLKEIRAMISDRALELAPRDKWVCAFELPSLRIEVNKNSNQ